MKMKKSNKQEAREAYLATRKDRIGTTDVAAILGMSPYANAYDIWLHKTGKLEKPDDMKDAARAGIAFEDGVLDWAEETLLGPLKRKIVVLGESLPIPMGTELDAIIKSSGEPVNAKTAGLIGKLDSEKWGTEGTDQVPDVYYIQAQIEMLLTNQQNHHLPAFLGGKGFAYYRIERSDDILTAVMDKLIDFWDNNVQKDVPPANIMPHLEVVKYRKRIEHKLVTVDEAIIQEYIAMNQAAKDAEALKETAQEKLLAALGDGEATQFIEGIGQVTYLPRKTRRIDTERLKTVHPDVYAVCLKETESRTMVIRKKEMGGKE